MGWRYVSFRGKHEILRRSGLLKSRFPVDVPEKHWVGLDTWKSTRGKFFFSSKSELSFPRLQSSELQQRFIEYKAGRLLFFNSLTFDLGHGYDWITNPDTGYKYDLSKHWTEIPDYSSEAGDIKFVWEKSRFSFLYDLIRYDYHFGRDCSADVFGEIESWIDKNPVNRGPNYRCSQEISLRVLNWIFALYYYSDSTALSDRLFKKIQSSIYWQIHHVFHNIDFSRIAVRNNHAITETLALYLVSLFFPDQQDFKIWGAKGKIWLEEEVSYQIYEDGTFLQFSMNYHRVVVQLLSWSIRLSELNGMRLAPIVYKRAAASVSFLRTCMEDRKGWLPNYGANDGALFFKLNDEHYRNYRPQLDALAKVLGIDAAIDQQSEDIEWYGGAKSASSKMEMAPGIYTFKNGGYYIFREAETITFIRCGSHKDRPSQADNLHMDVWHKGENILQDAGSYKYNTTNELLRFFMGTESHNTVMIDDHDQMLKGGRFIWYHWTQERKVEVKEDDTSFYFKGTIHAFKHLGKNLYHTRTVIKQKGSAIWQVQDQVENLIGSRELRQLWHTPLSKVNEVLFAPADPSVTVESNFKIVAYSGLYGQKEDQQQTCFSTRHSALKTIITFQKQK